MADEARSRLGRGLASLIGDVGGEAAHVDRPRAQRKVPIEFLKPNPRNPRREFPDAELKELADSIKQHGVIQPIVVRPVRGAADAFEIIAGERRWRAAQRAALHEVPVVVIEATDEESLQLAIIENVQRSDLNPLEEAEGYRALMEEFHNSQEEIAKIVGKSRSYIANTLRLLKLPDAVKGYIQDGRLTAGHARMLIGEPNAEQLAQDIVARDLNVREVEAMARERAHKSGKKQTGGKRARGASEKDADTLALERRLSDATGFVVTINDREGAGTLSIRYETLEQLDDIIARLDH